jgi:hypothetical protein
MADAQIILLPKDSYGDWIEAVKDYAMKFGVNFTNDPATAGQHQNPHQTVTLVTPANPLDAYDEDMTAWFAANYPGVKLDVVVANSPDELKPKLAARLTAGNRFAGAQIVTPTTVAPAAPPAPAPTPAPPIGPLIINGLGGELTLKSDKGRYAARIENIQFTETIKNHTSNTVKYSIIGVKGKKVSGDGPDFFHTSWSGDLSLGPNCTGPRDACGGPWDDSLTIDTPGAYRLTLDICFGGNDWQTLTTGLEISVVEWTPG